MTEGSAYYASQLRYELCLRSREFAKQHRLPHVESYGESPVVVYEPQEEPALHGNFLEETYQAILAHPEWCKRLSKIHAQARRALPLRERRWRELDSCTSSDALLMNVFCCPGVAESAAVRSLLMIESPSSFDLPSLEKLVELPRFGVKARVPLRAGLQDRTEVDMQFGRMLLEAKLTEGDFQRADASLLSTYRDLDSVFVKRDLPRSNGNFLSYQLIRNVLAAQANSCSFCVLLDARRPDLLESWYSIMRCVRLPDVRLRCKVLTWQELSEILPQRLQAFLDAKYGIVPPGAVASAMSNQDDSLGY